MYVFNSYTTNTIAVICIGLHGTLALNGANYPFTIVLNFDFLLVGRSCFLFKEMDNLVLFLQKFVYLHLYMFGNIFLLQMCTLAISKLIWEYAKLKHEASIIFISYQCKLNVIFMSNST